ncbi:hypothetical protein RBB68_15020 [Leptospira interrogans]|uniref:hypothetical protein n=1 Tax=Leptospira interrogans TaxID=173 RepID=UPI000ADEB4B2|nr:hypothetical protein [Leptospira interrogans]WML93675.1 hypothetical protein RBB68_15020 [Leptospira interrogans]
MNRVGKLNTTLSTDRVVGLVMIGSNALSSRSETLNLKDRSAEFAHQSLTHLIK